MRVVQRLMASPVAASALPWQGLATGFDRGSVERFVNRGMSRTTTRVANFGAETTRVAPVLDARARARAIERAIQSVSPGDDFHDGWQPVSALRIGNAKGGV